MGNPKATGIAGLANLRYGSRWLVVEQSLIDAFATVTGDHQFIHVDPARAQLTPFGGTIAHGFLLLSLLPHLHASADRPVTPALAMAMAINYGFDRIRFITPVRAGSLVRAFFTVSELVEKRPGEWQQALDVEMIAQGADRPVLLARWLSRMVLATDAGT